MPAYITQEQYNNIITRFPNNLITFSTLPISISSNPPSGTLLSNSEVSLIIRLSAEKVLPNPLLFLKLMFNSFYKTEVEFLQDISQLVKKGLLWLTGDIVLLNNQPNQSTPSLALPTNPHSFPRNTSAPTANNHCSGIAMPVQLITQNHTEKTNCITEQAFNQLMGTTRNGHKRPNPVQTQNSLSTEKKLKIIVTPPNRDTQTKASNIQAKPNQTPVPQNGATSTTSTSTMAATSSSSSTENVVNIGINSLPELFHCIKSLTQTLTINIAKQEDLIQRVLELENKNANLENKLAKHDQLIHKVSELDEKFNNLQKTLPSLKLVPIKQVHPTGFFSQALTQEHQPNGNIAQPSSFTRVVPRQ